ncbi:DUF3572 domain-containing protein [Sphingomonas sp. C3-2]|uniref:DUF3572 domain-containing protein n=1 Tax=Sphingomonas sp. C3-2 TaxID=3062169 RepID=UPI00294B2D4F|nr:DUF3572 domain-containing protein [Sphingomonas sp. C3-2]WOK38006.1 DUF3572 domain-containing protein [Sphingomonas sp. C3-2]
MKAPETNIQNAEALALSALVWILGDQPRAERLLTLTGLSPDDLRARAGDSAVLAAVLGFLEAHEPDLVACAGDIDCKPEALVTARRALDGGHWE